MAYDIGKIVEQGRETQLEQLVQGDWILLMENFQKKELVCFNKIEGDRIHWFGPNLEEYSSLIEEIPFIFKAVKRS